MPALGKAKQAAKLLPYDLHWEGYDSWRMKFARYYRGIIINKKWL